MADNQSNIDPSFIMSNYKMSNSEVIVFLQLPCNHLLSPAWNHTLRNIIVLFVWFLLSLSHYVCCGWRFTHHSSVFSQEAKCSFKTQWGHCVKCVFAPLHQNPQGFHEPLISSLYIVRQVCTYVCRSVQDVHF